MQSTINLFVILFFSLSAIAGGPEETARHVAAGLNTGNAGAVASHFNTMVDLSLPGSEETYSKTQAGRVLKEFFSQNRVKSFKISKQGSSADGSMYCIGTLTTEKMGYRVYFLIRKTNGKELVQQLQIQENQ